MISHQLYAVVFYQSSLYIIAAAHELPAGEDRVRHLKLDRPPMPMDLAKKYSTRERRESAMQLLEMVGLADQAHKLPGMVSGGQQQRAAIARSLANDPDLLVADEPTGNLDSRNSADIFELFGRLVQQGKTLLMVTYDKELARRVPRIVEIIDGRITRDEFVGGAQWHRFLMRR